MNSTESTYGHGSGTFASYPGFALVSPTNAYVGTLLTGSRPTIGSQTGRYARRGDSPAFALYALYEPRIGTTTLFPVV
jgi:hypothetical protein|nr:hypothetical protein Q903MT_gene329 [Picea sitchensis]